MSPRPNGDGVSVCYFQARLTRFQRLPRHFLPASAPFAGAGWGTARRFRKFWFGHIRETARPIEREPDSACFPGSWTVCPVVAVGEWLDKIAGRAESNRAYQGEPCRFVGAAARPRVHLRSATFQPASTISLINFASPPSSFSDTRRMRTTSASSLTCIAPNAFTSGRPTP